MDQVLTDEFAPRLGFTMAEKVQGVLFSKWPPRLVHLHAPVDELLQVTCGFQDSCLGIELHMHLSCRSKTLRDLDLKIIPRHVFPRS